MTTRLPRHSTTPPSTTRLTMSIPHLRLVESIPGFFLGIEFLVYNVPYFIILSKLCSAYAMA